MMRGTMLVLHPYQNEPEIREIDFALLTELERLQWLKDGIGGGYIEAVPYFHSIEHDGRHHKCVAFCDEDGKRKQLDFNARATILWDQIMRRAVGCGCSPDYLVGQIAIVFGDTEFMEAL